MVADHINERHRGCRGGVTPICQRRDIEIDAFAFIDVALAIDEVRPPNTDGGRARGETPLALGRLRHPPFPRDETTIIHLNGRFQL